MPTSVGAAIDYLVATAATAVAGMSVVNQPVLVVDGQADELAPAMFVVGQSDPPPEPAGDVVSDREWMGLGGQRFQEDYVIPCFIDVRVPGTSQKTARDIGETIFDAFWPLVAADKTLGGALQGGRFAEIHQVTSTPSNVGTSAAPGRRYFISFGVHCQNLTT